MWWGYSPALDLQKETKLFDVSKEKCLEILIVDANDPRHIIKTIAEFYKHPNRHELKFTIVEPTIEQIARSIFLLSLSMEKNLGLQEATRYYLEIFGNTLLRPATAKFLISRSKKLINVITESLECGWLDLQELKFRDRDDIETIYKFWIKAACENFPIWELWDTRVRLQLTTRYDYKEGAFDWDYFMVLKNRDLKCLTAHEYKFWRENGVAFTWIEGEPVRGNPTFITAGGGRSQFSCNSDIRNGPFFCWLAENNETEQKDARASDVAENQLMKVLYEIRERKSADRERLAAHRDDGILNGTIVVDLMESKAEQEFWTNDFSQRQHEGNFEWIEIPNVKVQFQMVQALEKLTEKAKYEKHFDCIFVGEKRSLDQIPGLANILKLGGTFLCESRKFLVNWKDEEIQGHAEKLRDLALESGLEEIKDSNNSNIISRFIKIR